MFPNKCESFGALCRLCAKERPQGRLVDLKKEDEQLRDVVTKLTRLNTTVDFAEEGLPTTVCSECCCSLNDAYEFVQTVEQSKTTFKNILTTDKTSKDLRIIKLEQIEDPASIPDNAVAKNVNSNQVIKLKSEVKSESSFNEGHSSLTSVNTCDTSDGKHCLIVNVPKYSETTSQPLKSELPEGKSTNVTDVKKRCVIVQAKASERKTKTIIRELPDDYDASDYSELQSMPVKREPDTKSQKRRVIIQIPQNKSTKRKQPVKNTNTKRVKKTVPPKINYDDPNRKNPIIKVNIQQNWKDYIWRCSLCEIQFQTCRELTNHSMEAHNRCNAFNCLDCNRKSTILTRFMNHVKKHRDCLKWSCYLCFMTFRSPTHKNRHSIHRDSQYICPGCNTCFTSEDELEKHKNTYYKPRLLMTETLQQFEGKHKDGTCLLCGRTFRWPLSLYKHLIHMHNNDHMKPHICDICGKRYFHESNLKEHLLSHNDIRPYKCEVCQSSFKSPLILKEHAKKHDPRNRVTCEVCGKECATKRFLRAHMKMHVESRPHVCDVCNKGFKNKGGLIQHKRQHTGEKPFKCDACSLSFTNWSNHHRHMKLYHGKMSLTKKQIANQGAPSVHTEKGKNNDGMLPFYLS